MPDLFQDKNKDVVAGSDVAVDATTRAAKASKRKGVPRAESHHGSKAKLKYAGALTSALAKSLSDAPTKPTKDQLASSVIPDVIAAIEAFPGVKLSKLWPILKELGAENDGATFKRAVVRLLQKEAERLPVIKLSLKTRSPRAPGQSGQVESPPGAAPRRYASATDAEPALPDAKLDLEQELRSLRAPGF